MKKNTKGSVKLESHLQPKAFDSDILTDHEKEVEQQIMDVMERCTADKGITEESIEAVMTLELDIEIHKALVENLLSGWMIAEYKGSADKPLDIDKFVFKLSSAGKKHVEKFLLPKKKKGKKHGN